MLNFSLIPYLIFSSFISPFGFVISGYDIPRYLIEPFLPPPVLRTSRTIVTMFFLRLILIYPILLELMRQASFLICVTIVMLHRTCFILRVMISCCNFSLYSCYYQRFHISVKCILFEIKAIIYLVFTALFWTFVFVFWVLVKFSRHQISTPLYGFLAGILIMTTIGGYVAIPWLVVILEMSLQIVYYFKICMRLRFIKLQRRGDKINYYKARAVLPFRLMYGAFVWIDRDFFVDYLELLSLRCFDAIFIFN